MANKEGCSFCSGETSARFDGDNKMGLSIEFTENGTNIVAFGYNASGQHKEVKIPIEYCPKCARKLKSADKPKITCLNCKHLMFSDMYGECNKQLRIVHPSDTCEYAEPKESEVQGE